MPSRRRREEHEGRVPEAGVPSGPRNSGKSSGGGGGIADVVGDVVDTVGDVAGSVVDAAGDAASAIGGVVSSVAPTVTGTTAAAVGDPDAPSPRELAAAILGEAGSGASDSKAGILADLLSAPTPTIGDDEQEQDEEDKKPVPQIELPKMTGNPAQDIISSTPRSQEEIQKQKRGGLKEVIQQIARQGSSIAGLSLTPQDVQAIARSSARYGIDPADLTSIYEIETGFGENEGPSSAGAIGKMQFMPQTWEEYGKGRDPSNTYAAMDAAGRYLKAAGYKQGDEAAENEGIFAYNHADWYVDDVQEGAEKYEGIWNKAAKRAPNLGREGKGTTQGKISDVVDEEPATRMIKVRADAKGMVKWAEHFEGVTEGSKKHAQWSARFSLPTTEPWCANFISNGLVRRGITDLPSNPNYVPSYEEEWSQYAVDGGLDRAKPGDILTFSGRHIGLYVGNGEMISGNSSDRVQRTGVDSDLSMVLRPPYQGGTVKVPESMPGIPAAPSGSGSEVAGSTSLVGGVAEDNPILNAALTKTESVAPGQSKGEGLANVLGFLDAPVPTIGEPLEPLEMDDDLLKLALRRRV